VNHVRSPQAREQELPEGHHEMASGAADPLANVLENEAQRVLQQALLGLPPEQRAVLVLRAVEDLSYREIADALQIEMGTVMSRLSRAREKLRVALQPYLGTAAQRAGAGA
jgi:RNA polymerase sigma-70 factor (ECF subfamily)